MRREQVFLTVLKVEKKPHPPLTFTYIHSASNVQGQQARQRWASCSRVFCDVRSTDSHFTEGRSHASKSNSALGTPGLLVEAARAKLGQCARSRPRPRRPGPGLEPTAQGPEPGGDKAGSLTHCTTHARLTSSPSSTHGGARHGGLSTEQLLPRGGEQSARRKRCAPAAACAAHTPGAGLALRGLRGGAQRALSPRRVRLRAFLNGF